MAPMCEILEGRQFLSATLTMTAGEPPQEPALLLPAVQYIREATRRTGRLAEAPLDSLAGNIEPTPLQPGALQLVVM